MVVEQDVFSMIVNNAQGGVAVARAVANKGKPAVEVFKSAFLYEVAEPLVQKITKKPYRFRAARPLRI